MVAGPLILDVESTALTAADIALLQHPAVGGVILFSRNIADREQLVALTAAIRAANPRLLVAVDQEGGRVQRCRSGFTRLPPMQVFHRLSERDGLEQAVALARDCGWLMATELLACGIDFSFAPVLDVDDNYSSVIGDRSFSADPHRVSALAGAFIEGMHAAGMAATGKHFPGHGSVRADSHHELPVDTRSLAEVSARDLIPFRQLLPVLDAVMPAHICFTQIDSLPVGFSRLWLRQILRGEMEFDGVIFSDDLSMAGAAAMGSYARRVELALTAGCDVVLVCNHRAGALEAVDYLRDSNQLQAPRLEAMRPRPEPATAAQALRLQQIAERLAALLADNC
jgi:beta-N-acetylhexosaminidase